MADCKCTKNSGSCGCDAGNKACQCGSDVHKGGASQAADKGEAHSRLNKTVHDEACSCNGTGKGCQCKDTCTCGQS